MTDEVTGEWRKLHNQELIDLYSSLIFLLSDQIEKNELGGACMTFGGEDRCVQYFVAET